MSHDEIVFDDVKHREPERRRRPDRDRRVAALAYEIPLPNDLPIFLDRATADVIERHALRDTSVELGGVLLGKECLDESTGLPFVMVAKSLEAKHFENTQASFTYTHDSWEEITRERDRLHPDLDIVGWYHTHPDFGIFLSSHDVFIHRHFFGQPLQVAYVVDPIRQTRGFFQWRNGTLEQVGGYHLFADRGDRIALARLVNDLENLPNADGGSGGFSPRLEAELIAMLSRPAHAPAFTPDRIQTAAIFSMIGALAGIVVLAAAFWLFSLGNQIREQSLIIRDLEKSSEQTAAKQSLALDALLEQGSGVSAEKFTDLYHHAAHDRDEAKRKLIDQNTMNEELAARLRILGIDHTKLIKERDELTQEVEGFRKDKKDVAGLVDRVRTLQSDLSASERRVRKLASLLDTVEGKQVVELDRKYQVSWYAAAVGWSVGLLLVLGLLILILRNPVTPDVPPAPPEVDSPTHRIL